jgi:gamma-glutamylcyclotransferase (GGCT)/AIG2-like uncharacterized protein YtfP
VLQKGPGGCINCALTKSGIFIGNGTFRGKLYKIGHYPGAIPSDGESDRVKGDVYLLPNPDDVLESLDRFEGCTYDERPGTECQDSGEFYRDRVTVHLENGDEVIAWVYIYNRPIEGLNVIPSGDYWKR